MIVPTMSYPEIYCVLENAAPKIRYKTEQLCSKAVKYFTREVWKYPAWKTYEYTIPATNDTYVIFFYAADAGAADKPLAGSFCYLRHWNPWQVMVVRMFVPFFFQPSSLTTELMVAISLIHIALRFYFFENISKTKPQRRPKKACSFA